MPRVVCPKCSQEGWLIKKRLKGRWYLYVDHYIMGRHIVHYIGPAGRHPELARLLGIELEAVSSKTQGNAGNQDSSKLEVPSYEEFMAFVEAKAKEGDKDAEKLLKRAKKDAATIRRTLLLLSRLS